MLGNSRWANCRWCGSDWKLLQLVPQMDEDPKELSVVCTNCGAAGPQAKGRKAAVKLWNEGPLYNKKGERFEEVCWTEGD